MKSLNVRVQAGKHRDSSTVDAELLYARTFDRLGYLTDLHVMNDDGTVSDKWSAAATHFGAFVDGKPCGHMRLIDRSAGTLPVEEFQPGLDLPDRCHEVSALAVEAGAADSLEIARHMYRSAWTVARKGGFTHWVAMVEPFLYEVLTGVLNFPFKIIADGISYGDTSGLVVILVEFEEVYEAIDNGMMDGWYREELV